MMDNVLYTFEVGENEDGPRERVLVRMDLRQANQLIADLAGSIERAIQGRCGQIVAVLPVFSVEIPDEIREQILNGQRDMGIVEENTEAQEVDPDFEGEGLELIDATPAGGD